MRSIWLISLIMVSSGFSTRLVMANALAKPEELPTPTFERITDDEADTDLLYEALEDVIDEQYERAIPKLERVLEEDPNAMPAWEALGWSYWHVGRRDAAIRLWQELLTLNPQSAKAHNLLAMAATAEDDLERGIRHYRKSLEIDPDQFAPRYALARISRWQGDMDAAVALADPLLQEDPDRLDVRLELARALLQNWQFAEALPHWEAIHAAAPDYTPYQVALASARLNTDDVEGATALLRAVLNKESENEDALTLVADKREYGDRPARAIPVLRRLIDVTEDPRELHARRTRLVRLYVRLHRRDPQENPLDDAIRITEEMVEADPRNADTRMLLGELYSMNRQFAEAEEHLLYVLEHMNPQNQRAHRGLFEVYVGWREHKKAWEQFEAIQAFNPDDPYLYYRLARYEAGRGHFYNAFQALDELERRGRQGAVAVLLYHAISPSDWTSTPSVRRVREQIAALQAAGFQFITPEELPAYLAQAAAEPLEEGDFESIPRVAMVTFDDALRSSMKHGTAVAEELDLRFTQFVITGFTERGDPFVSSWDELQDWQRTGRWSFHSQLYLSEDRRPLTEDGYLGRPLANRLWLPEQNRLETPEEFAERLAFDYPHSQTLLRRYLGGDEGVGTAIAYPFGEIGQENESNMPNAIRLNLATAAAHFDTGYIQSPFGYAVTGDNPHLYQRHELHRSAEGEEALAQVLENHPVLLAERMRAEFSALAGKVYGARRALRNLEEAGYPEPSQEAAETYVKERMARRFAAPTAAEEARRGSFEIELRDPYVGANMRYFRDNLGRRNWFQQLQGGLNITPRLTVEARGGRGRLKQDTRQPAVNGIPQPRLNLRVDERHLGLRGAYVLHDRALLAAEGTERSFSKDADWDLFAYAFEGFFKPFVILDTFIRYERDAVESAFSVTEEIYHEMLAANGILKIRDWWDLWLAGVWFDFSDGNDRTHYTLASQWLVWERVGLHLGLRYSYATSEEERLDYWTPYQLHRYYVEAVLREHYLRTYYNAGIRVGVGRQSRRPEARAAFAESVERARRLQFDPGEEPASDGWEPILGLYASTRIRFRHHWTVTGEIAHNRLPDYNEWHMNAGVAYRF